VTARLKQQHVDIGMPGQPACDDGSGRAGATDDEVVFRPQRRGEATSFRRTRASNSELESEPLPASMIMVVLDVSGSQTTYRC
jgi:hypothetical protein